MLGGNEWTRGRSEWMQGGSGWMQGESGWMQGSSVEQTFPVQHPHLFHSVLRDEMFTQLL